MIVNLSIEKGLSAIAALGFPARTIEEIIKKLVKLNRLERIGEGKATRYKICQAIIEKIFSHRTIKS